MLLVRVALSQWLALVLTRVSAWAGDSVAVVPDLCHPDLSLHVHLQVLHAATFNAFCGELL